MATWARDPEVRATRDGKAGRHPEHRHRRELGATAGGNRVERTEWHRVVIWNEGLGKIAEKYLGKGAKVYVEGKLVTNGSTGGDGVERYSAGNPPDPL